MTQEWFMGHRIDVTQLQGARPWAVYVDQELLYGRRIRRRLAYSSREAALAAGRKHVRELVSKS